MNHTFQVNINTDTAAFGEWPGDLEAEVVRILKVVIRNLESQGCVVGDKLVDGKLFDKNGNRVGYYGFYTVL